MNLYDDFQPDVGALLRAQDAMLVAANPTTRSAAGLGIGGHLASRLRLYGTAALVKSGLHQRLIYANLRLAWFHQFRDYWMGVLGCRPIHPHDFYYLMGVYRQRLQTIDFPQLSDPSLASDQRHLEAWRDPRAIYYLFAHTYRLALSPLRVHRLTRWIPRGGRVAEFGCGAAPITTGLASYYRHLDLAIVAADIPHLLFHYARWKFRGLPFVTMVPIVPDDDRPLAGEYDTIFCLEVLEHVPRPLAVLQHFHGCLRPGGHLVFDFIESEGTGFDTTSALRDRRAALEFVRDHFDVVSGRNPLDGDGGMEPVVARKRGARRSRS